jgi:hypothetical protein
MVFRVSYLYLNNNFINPNERVVKGQEGMANQKKARTRFTGQSPIHPKTKQEKMSYSTHLNPQKRAKFGVVCRHCVYMRGFSSPFSQQRDREVRVDAQTEGLCQGTEKATQQPPQWEVKEDILQLEEIGCPKARHGVPTLRRLYKKPRSPICASRQAQVTTVSHHSKR